MDNHLPETFVDDSAFEQRFADLMEAEVVYRALSGTKMWPAWMTDDAVDALRESRIHARATTFFIERFIQWHHWGIYVRQGRITDTHRDHMLKVFYNFDRPRSWTKKQCAQAFDDMFALAYRATLEAAYRQMKST
jgi:hypothetical protein